MGTTTTNTTEQVEAFLAELRAFADKHGMNEAEVIASASDLFEIDREQ